MTPEGKVGTVVPMHRELKLGTLRSVLKLAKIEPEEFERHQ
jgi:predicted RNA binding protein YcfA (HicA-like mRNA interferase family)